jgi:hypothetical protein
MSFNLSTLSVILGLGMALPSAYGMANPSGFSNLLRKFPRSIPAGFILMLLGTGWFVYNVSRESIADFESYKQLLYSIFVLVGLGSCFFVRDFLAVRGAAVVMLLLANSMLDAARWSDSDWSVVIKIWAYLLVIAGIWFTVSPWRMRDVLLWHTASVGRIRALSALRLAFGLLVIFLGLKAF